MTRIVVFGASFHAVSVTETVRSEGWHEIVAYVDEHDPARARERFPAARIASSLAELEDLRAQGVSAMIVAVGDCRTRMALAQRAAATGWHFVSTIHPRAIVGAEVTIGVGTVVCPGAVIRSRARIGAQVILNTAATLEDGTMIGDGAHISVGVHLGCAVHVARGAHVEIGSVVAAGVQIGAGSVVGAGSLVLHDVPDGVLVHGSPARVRRELDRNEA